MSIMSESSVAACETSTLDKQGTSSRPRLRFSIRTVLLLIAIVGAALAFVSQQRRLAELQAALWRYEAESIPTELADDEFRVIARQVVDSGHLQVVSYRIESAGEHFATLQCGGDSNGSRSNYDPNTRRHVSEAVIVLDHLDTQQKLKLMAMVGGAHGYGVDNVPSDFKLRSDVKFFDIDGVHPRADAVDVVRYDGRVYSLRLKK
jgi:hypothetical protein